MESLNANKISNLVKRFVTELMVIMEKKNELIDNQANEIEELKQKISLLETGNELIQRLSLL
jgi:hypothetical protein